MLKTLIAMIALTVGTAAFAATTTTVCTKSTLPDRTIALVQDEGDGIPCQVNYTKENKPTMTLWRAVNDPTYCVKKSAWLVDRLEAVGYVCTVQ